MNKWLFTFEELIYFKKANFSDSNSAPFPSCYITLTGKNNIYMER